MAALAEGFPTALGTWTLEVVKRSDAARGFQLLPRVVARTLAWLNRNRRLAKDFEAVGRDRRGLADAGKRQATYAQTRLC